MNTVSVIENDKMAIADLPGYEGSYCVGMNKNTGDIQILSLSHNKKRGDYLRVMKLWTNPTGYQSCCLKDGTKMYVHQAVMRAFGPPQPEGTEINHIDGDKSNNRLRNLEWKSHRDNCRHSWGTLGLKCKTHGADHWRAKMTDDAVAKLRQLHSEGKSITWLASLMDVTVPTMSDLVNKNTWKHVTGVQADLTEPY